MAIEKTIYKTVPAELIAIRFYSLDNYNALKIFLRKHDIIPIGHSNYCGKSTMGSWWTWKCSYAPEDAKVIREYLQENKAMYDESLYI